MKNSVWRFSRKLCLGACLFLLAACSSEPMDEDPFFRDDANSSTNNAGVDMGDVEDEEDEVPDVEGFRIATWNVRFFYDDVCDSGACGDDTRERLPTTAEFQSRGEQIAMIMRQVDADVFLLQEVETQASLDELRQHLGDEYTVWEIGEIRRAGSIDTAVVARVGMNPVIKKHRQDSFIREDGLERQFLREFLELRLDWDGQKVIVFSTHFRSKVNDDPVQREAEAKRAREIVQEVGEDNPDAIVVLGGDLNDTPDSRTLELLQEDGGFLRVAEVLSEDWTINSRGRLAAFDHLLLVRGRGEVVEGSVEIVRQAITQGGSDHAVVVAEFVPSP